MPFSLHSHSGEFCRHAKGSLEAVVIEAIRQGFRTYGLTEHMPRFSKTELYPEEHGLTLNDLMDTFESFLVEATRLKSIYATKIQLFVGLETEHTGSSSLMNLERLLLKHADTIDYIVGSVHHVKAQPIDFDEKTFARCLASFPSIGAYLCAYFDAQHELLERFQPEVVGHFDLCRRFIPDEDLHAHDVWSRVHRNIECGVAYGALFEVNAAAFRKGWKTAYPGPDVLRLIVSLGGRLTLSDDSHTLDTVGLHYADTRDYLRREGVDELWCLQAVAGPNTGRGRARVVARRVDGHWWQDDFWTKAAAAAVAVEAPA